MPVLVGIWFAIAGAVAVLAGLSAMRRADGLRLRGVAAWATVARGPDPAGDVPDGGDPDPGLLIRYTLADGRPMEQPCPASLRKSSALIPGEKVRIWYDGTNPDEVLISGRDGHYGDWAFAITGILLILAGTGIARFGG